MNRRCLRSGLSLLLVTLSLLLVACGGNDSASTTGNDTAITNSADAKALLAKTRDAMQKVKSAHLDTQRTVKLTQSVGSASTMVTESTDQVLPDQLSSQLVTKNDQVNQGTKTSELYLQNKIYLQSPDNQWFVFSKERLQAINNMPTLQLPTNLNTLNELLEISDKGTVVDQKTETVNGQQLHHLNIGYDKTALTALRTAGQENSILAQVKTAKDAQVNADFWIDEQSAHVLKSDLKITLTQDTNGNSATTNSESTVTLSRFDQLASISAPQGAKEVDDPGSIFQQQP